MKKKVLCMSLAVILLSQTGVMAAQEHKHVWIDDIKNSDETTNRYYCECGEVRDEIIADIRNFVVSFDANGGYVETETVETYKNRIKRLPIPENASDYQWDGWYTEPDGGEIVTEDWVYDSDTTLYARLNELLALTEESGKYTKYAGSVKEYSISNMRIEFENAEFAQGDAEKNLNGTVYIDVEIPVRFGGRELVPIQFTMRVKASYIPKF